MQPRKTTGDRYQLAGLNALELHARLLQVMNYTRDHMVMTAAESAEALAIVEAGADLSVRGTGGQEVLLTAVAMKDVRLVKAMLDRGANVDAQNKGGNSALMTAAAWGSAEMIKTIVAARPNPYLKDNSGYDAIGNALLFERRESICALIRAAYASYDDMLAQQAHHAAGLPVVKTVRSTPLKPFKKP